MSKLAAKKTTDSGGGVLRGAKLKELKKKLGSEWKLVKEKQLQKELKFKDFREALAYTNKVGELAESIGHHPDIFLAWGQVKADDLDAFKGRPDRERFRVGSQDR